MPQPLLYGAPNPVIMALECYSTLAKLFAEKTTEIMAHDNTAHTELNRTENAAHRGSMSIYIYIGIEECIL